MLSFSLTCKHMYGKVFACVCLLSGHIGTRPLFSSVSLCLTQSRKEKRGRVTLTSFSRVLLSFSWSCTVFCTWFVDDCASLRVCLWSLRADVSACMRMHLCPCVFLLAVQRHTGAVECLLLIDDVLVSGGWDGLICMWRYEGGVGFLLAKELQISGNITCLKEISYSSPSTPSLSLNEVGGQSGGGGGGGFASNFVSSTATPVSMNGGGGGADSASQQLKRYTLKFLENSGQAQKTSNCRIVRSLCSGVFLVRKASYPACLFRVIRDDIRAEACTRVHL